MTMGTAASVDATTETQTDAAAKAEAHMQARSREATRHVQRIELLLEDMAGTGAVSWTLEDEGAALVRCLVRELVAYQKSLTELRDLGAKTYQMPSLQPFWK